MSTEEKTKLVPKLRFPEFRDAAPWQPVSLGEASTPVTERVGTKKLTPVSISAGIGFVPQAEKFGRDISGNQYQLYTLVKDGDFVYNKGNSLKFPEGCIYLLQGWGEVAAPNVFICFRLKSDYSNGFFQNCFESNAHGKQLKKHITSGARSNGLLNISKDAFFSVEIPTPSSIEQQKIADCLSSLDELIAAQARKVEALKTHKKGLMQQLFPRKGETQPRLRFPEFQNAADWQRVRLDEIGRVIRGSSPRPQGDTRFFGGPVPRLMVQDVTRDGKWVTPRIDSLTEEGATMSRPCPAGTLTIVCSGVVGVVSFLAIDACIHDGFLALVDIDESRADKDFLFHTLSTLRNEFERGATHGGVFTNLTTQGIKDFVINFPGIPEQQRIASFLTCFDALITAAVQELDTLKTHKKGLMQQLFPSLEEAEA
jgi:type I restriction enzyme S subunit